MRSGPCAQTCLEALVVDGHVPPHSTADRLRDWRPQRTHLPATLEADSAGLSRVFQFQRFLAGVCRRFSRRTPSLRRERDGGNSPYGTLEQHVAATRGPVCAENLVVLEIGSLALSDHQTVHDYL